MAIETAVERSGCLRYLTHGAFSISIRVDKYYGDLRGS
jgi:hypothetical protein